MPTSGCSPKRLRTTAAASSICSLSFSTAFICPIPNRPAGSTGEPAHSSPDHRADSPDRRRSAGNRNRRSRTPAALRKASTARRVSPSSARLHARLYCTTLSAGSSVTNRSSTSKARSCRPFPSTARPGSVRRRRSPGRAAECDRKRPDRSRVGSDRESGHHRLRQIASQRVEFVRFVGVWHRRFSFLNQRSIFKQAANDLRHAAGGLTDRSVNPVGGADISVCQLPGTDFGRQECLPHQSGIKLYRTRRRGPVATVSTAADANPLQSPRPNG